MRMHFYSSILLLFVLPVCFSYGSDFYTEITADQLEYVAIEVPRHASYFEVQLWAESSRMNPTVLLRYDGLPTLTLYDAKLGIPSPPFCLQILDLQPTQSVLYLGLFGGSKLHRFRYFAGEATSKLTGVQSEIKSCSSEYQRGPNCTQSEVLSAAAGSLKSTNAMLTVGATLTSVVTIPKHTERFLIEISIENVVALCVDIGPLENRNFTFVFDLYLDQPLEENNAGRRVVHFNSSTLCVSSTHIKKSIASLMVERPMPGVWTLQSIVLRDTEFADYTTAAVRKSGITNNESDSTIFGKKRVNVRIADRALLNQERQARIIVRNQDFALGAPLQVPLTITSVLSMCPSGTTMSPIRAHSIQAQERYRVKPEEVLAQSRCTASVEAMDAVHTPLISRGMYALHGRTAILPSALSTNNTSISRSSRIYEESISATDDAESNPFVVFEAVLPAHVQRLAVGGGMILQLSVSLADANDAMHLDQFVHLMDSMQFHIAARFAGLPGDPDEYQHGTTDANNLEAWSPNAFILSTRSATIADQLVNSASSDDDDSSSTRSDTFGSLQMVTWQWLEQIFRGKLDASPVDAHLRERTHTTRTNTRTYTWVITRPALPDLSATSLDGGRSHLFIRVAREPVAPSENGKRVPSPKPFGIMHSDSNNRVDNIGERKVFHRGDNARANDRSTAASTEAAAAAAAAAAEALHVAASLVFEPCPKGSCVHGECYTQEGDVGAYACSCRYPWAGESCDSLSVPYSFYIVQVLILTLSNLMMLPAVLLSIACQLPFVATLLGSSAAASAVYHLCDVDVYCLGGLSFHSLQVMDILFSICSISSILLLYAPMSRSVHTAVSLLCLALLVPPVADQPTSPVNLVLALTFALLVLAVGWGAVLRQGDRRGSQVTHLLGGLFLHTQSDPLLHGTAGASGEEVIFDKPLAVVTNGEEMVYSSIARNSPELREEDIEMMDLSQGITPSTEYFDNSSDLAAVYSSNGTCPEVCVEHERHVWALPAVGMLVGLVGLMCFALQRRENYYISHSLWHVFMMISAYLLVRGRRHLYVIRAAG